MRDNRKKPVSNVDRKYTAADIYWLGLGAEGGHDHPSRARRNHYTKDTMFFTAC